MRTTQDAPTQREAGQVIVWRRDQLAAAGFDTPLASALAADRSWDLHALLELVERGCPPALAVAILSPLDTGVTR